MLINCKGCTKVHFGFTNFPGFAIGHFICLPLKCFIAVKTMHHKLSLIGSHAFLELKAMLNQRQI